MGIEVVPKVTGADDFSFFQRLIPGVDQGFTDLGFANAAGPTRRAWRCNRSVRADGAANDRPSIRSLKRSSMSRQSTSPVNKPLMWS